MWNDKAFCCHGCSTVYQILNENQMGEYYKIQPMSGIKIVTDSQSGKFAFLDNEEIRQNLLDFTDENVSKIRFFIPAIHCASCIWLLENLSTLDTAIKYSSVNFPKKEVTVTFNHNKLSLRQLAELLAAIHYIPEITLDQLDKTGKTKSDQNLLIKIGIASFSFLNIMMYSFPEYLPGGDLLEKEFKDIFGWLSFILILPVVFYSSIDYYLSAWKGIRHKIISIDLPISLGIIALFLQSSWVVFHDGGIGFMDTLAGLLFFLLIGKWYQSKTYEALSFERDYKSYFPVAVTKIEKDKEIIIPIKNLKKGDRILVRNQELIPTDAFIIKGNGNIDYSFVTGESVPVSKKLNDFIYAGGRQIGSSIELVVEKEVEQSYLTQLWNQADEKMKEISLNTHVNKVSQYFTIVILIIATAAFGYWFTESISTAVYVFTSVLIIACPCALALTVPFTLGSTMRVFGRKGLYLKNTDVVEQLHKTDTIVFDKTGTITLNREMKTNFHGESLSDYELSQVQSLVRNSGHPLSKALHDNLPQSDILIVEDFQELVGMGLTGMVDHKEIKLGSHLFVTGIKSDESFTESRVYLKINGELKGYCSFANSYRGGLAGMIQQLGSAYELHLISGDNDSEKQRLTEIFGNKTRLHFNQSPTDKKAYIESLRASGKHVLMIGDGLNDAGALSKSNTGLTVADDVFSFSPACDAILEATAFSRLIRFIQFSHTSFKVIKASFFISLTYNIIGLSFAVSAKLSPLVAAILMPLSSITIISFVTISISILASRKLKG
ncbi:MAG: HAD-IC family P-type ATPase [Bacteroidales bacterium]|nr:HAD-IC family P-type ATPase [Bacteroidales bacterium]